MRFYDNLKLAYPQSQVLELMRAEEEVKLLKKENTEMLSNLEANSVELRMLRAAVDAFKIIEQDAGYRAEVLGIELKKCQTDLATQKQYYEDIIKDLRLKLGALETDFAGQLKKNLKPLLFELDVKDQL